MAINYSDFLSDEQKKGILQQRLAQFAAEAYQHEINKTVAESTKNEDALKNSEDALAVLKVAIEVHAKELNALG